MEDSILESVKHMLGPGSCDDHFDNDIIIFINGVFSTLTQIGVGPKGGFSISGPAKTWGDYLGNDPELEMVKTYVYTKVKLRFDPPAGSASIQLLQQDASELEFRLSVAVDH